MPIAIAYGTHQPKGSFLLRLIGPLFKSKLWDNKPWKEGLPTDPTFITTGTTKDFEKVKFENIALNICGNSGLEFNRKDAKAQRNAKTLLIKIYTLKVKDILSVIAS